MTEEMIPGAISVFVVLLFLIAVFRDFGYKAGVKKGYAAGRKDADNWWIEMETEVEGTRRKMWREGIER